MSELDDVRREAWVEILATIAAVDRHFDRLAVTVTEIVRIHAGDGWTDETIRRMLLDIDAALAAVFGPTQEAAAGSAMYRTISDGMARSARLPNRRAIAHVQRAVEATDPALWSHVRHEMIRRAALPASTDRFALIYLDTTGQASTAHLVRLQAVRSLDPQRRWVPRDQWTTRTGYRLSDRIWRHSRRIRRQIEQTIRRSVRSGASPYSLARELTQYLKPSASPIVYRRDGRVVRRNMTNRPGGWASSHARTLARTEIIRAYGMATIEAAEAAPGTIGIKWNLSNAHPRRDICDTHAHRDTGLGPGVYRRRDLPGYPAHPNELCILTIVFTSPEEIVRAIVARYGQQAA